MCYQKVTQVTHFFFAKSAQLAQNAPNFMLKNLKGTQNAQLWRKKIVTVIFDRKGNLEKKVKEK